MRILPLLVFLSAAVGPLAAQSPLTANPLPAAPQPESSFPAPDFRLAPPGVIQDERSFPGTGQSLPLSYQAPHALGAPNQQRNSTCYFIQAYQVARIDPESGAHKFIPVTGCRIAQSQVRDAVSSQQR
jgi:hypothetical protein